MPLVESWGVLLSNAYDADGMDGLQVELVGQATNGHVEISSNGSFVYTPNLNYWGPDSFTYRVYDGFEYSNLATATLTIYASNDPPVASEDTFSLPEDVQCFTADVLANDLDIDGDSLNVVLTSYSVPGQLGCCQVDSSNTFRRRVQPRNVSRMGSPLAFLPRRLQPT
jgi:hypothetical protein